ncbi:MAG: hypothetical protein M1396_06570 [Chloroflexi bacterium]|nr:hypothetical protein [Chloroflexota bacterium]
MIYPHTRLWLNPFWPPHTPFEWRVASLLRRGPLPVESIVPVIAGLAVWEEYFQGTWSLEVGAQALSVLAWEVTLELLQCDGTLVFFETPLPERQKAMRFWELLPAA